MNKYLEIYTAFAKMGAVTFGGGYAMLPILKREAVENKGWITDEEVVDYYAVSQGLPGIIAINVSVFIGYRRGGVGGGIAAALGCVTPSIAIILVLAACLARFQDNPYVQNAMGGISVCVAALILGSVLDLWKKSVRSALGLVLCVLMFAFTEFTAVSPILLIICAGAVGIISAFSKRGADE